VRNGPSFAMGSSSSSILAWCFVELQSIQRRSECAGSARTLASSLDGKMQQNARSQVFDISK